MVVERNPTERNVVGAVALERARHMAGGSGATARADPQRGGPWLTLAESCTLVETEEEEEKLIRAPPGLSDPLGEGGGANHLMAECPKYFTRKCGAVRRHAHGSATAGRVDQAATKKQRSGRH